MPAQRDRGDSRTRKPLHGGGRPRVACVVDAGSSRREYGSSTSPRVPKARRRCQLTSALDVDGTGHPLSQARRTPGVSASPAGLLLRSGVGCLWPNDGRRAATVRPARQCADMSRRRAKGQLRPASSQLCRSPRHQARSVAEDRSLRAQAPAGDRAVRHGGEDGRRVRGIRDPREASRAVAVRPRPADLPGLIGVANPSVGATDDPRATAGGAGARRSARPARSRAPQRRAGP